MAQYNQYGCGYSELKALEQLLGANKDITHVNNCETKSNPKDNPYYNYQLNHKGSSSKFSQSNSVSNGHLCHGHENTHTVEPIADHLKNFKAIIKPRNTNISPIDAVKSNDSTQSDCKSNDLISDVSTSENRQVFGKSENNNIDLEQPKYEFCFSQTVSSDDVYGGGAYSQKYNGSECCENIILKIYLEKEDCMKNFLLDCNAESVTLKTPNYHLQTMLPKPVYPNQSTAKWIADKKILKLKLKVNAEFIDV